MRNEDIKAAFANEKVKGIFSVIGGYNCNQILNSVDYETIERNPTLICGYSDISVLCNAIFFKTGLVTYLGPHFSTWGMKHYRDYTREYFHKCCMQNEPFELHASTHWADGNWFTKQNSIITTENSGYWSVNEGIGEGTVVGGNLNSISLLFGTKYFNVKNSIILIEDTAQSNAQIFDRKLQSLIHQNGFSSVKGLIIGRFQRDSKITRSLLKQIIKSKPELRKIPIIANVDTGHTFPMVTFPIGGKAIVCADKYPVIKILKH